MTSTPPPSSTPPASSTSTPARSNSPTPSSYFPSSLASSVSSLLRRISTPVSSTSFAAGAGTGGVSSFMTDVTSAPSYPASSNNNKTESSAFYTPPHRHASPFQPPPLYPLSLRSHLAPHTQVLSRSLAEEIRLLLPPRLQLVESWDLAYSLEQDGVSLATLYKKCGELEGVRRGYVLVVKDGEGGVRDRFSPLLLFLSSTDGRLDLRSLSDSCAASVPPLLRHRRVFPLASIDPDLDLHVIFPGLVAASTT